MKTINAYHTIIAALAIVFGFTFTSCSSADDEYIAPTSENQISEAVVKFTYTVPEELFKYAEITVCYNTNDGSDARWEPMLDNTFTVTYDLSKFPVTAPVVMVYETTNRPAYGKTVDWNITMNVEAVMTIDGKREVRSNSETYKLDGDLGAGIDALMQNVVDRTYAVKINRVGDIQFVH